jgi:hypothetical protein
MSTSDLGCPELPEFTMLCHLLRLTSSLRNGNGDISMPEYQDSMESTNVYINRYVKPSRTPHEDLDLLELDSVSSLLVRDTDDVISACYRSSECISLITSLSAADDDQGTQLKNGRGSGNIRINEFLERLTNVTSVLPLEVTTTTFNSLSSVPGETITIKPLSSGVDHWPRIRDSEDAWTCCATILLWVILLLTSSDVSHLVSKGFYKSGGPCENDNRLF